MRIIRRRCRRRSRRDCGNHEADICVVEDEETLLAAVAATAGIMRRAVAQRGGNLPSKPQSPRLRES
jgi:hypothetical protein